MTECIANVRTNDIINKKKGEIIWQKQQIYMQELSLR